MSSSARRGAARRWVADGLVTAFLLLIGAFGSHFAQENQQATGTLRTPLDALAYGLIFAAAAVTLVRRRWPVSTLAVVAGMTAAYLIIGFPYGPILITLAVVIYTMAEEVPLRRAAWLCGGAFVLLALHAFVPFTDPTNTKFGGLLPAAAFVAVPFAIGVTVKVSREAVQRSRADEARRIADDERLRVAQEVHDVVGHGLAAINMQAEIALHLLPRKPEEAEAALTRISLSSKAALDELRVTLSVLRSRGERAPAPGLAQVPALRDRLAESGLPVSLSVVGSAFELPLAVDLAAYRVVQESLTNVLRHAGAASAAVVITYLPASVEAEVTDTGRGGVVGDVPGHGLQGMRERVTALGGTLTAGPLAAGRGWRVHASLPVGAGLSSDEDR
ncbi:Signal transduction histidine kinase [Asanoa hainanensis]|uniref:histidine kinase n=1 Tax=Asanoa hainanensis TaxID=560556 RepID=A0A239PDZ2_9ACTN|nr:histidine kinase [Asanoa hainanensis]SNT65247.1 Signal transduction histidine kinase [Asanoa hainanensis]